MTTETDVKRLAEGLDWITASARLDAAERVARGILTAPADPRRNEASTILGIVDRVRRAHRRGWPVPAGDMEQLRILSDAANTKIIRPLLERGIAFRDGPKKPRVDALGRLIIDAMKELGAKAPAKDVLRHVEKHGAGVVDEIDGETIYWHRPNGKDEATTFKTFDNRVSEYRKKIED